MLGPMLKPWEKVVEGESIKEEVVVVPEGGPDDSVGWGVQRSVKERV